MKLGQGDQNVKILLMSYMIYEWPLIADSEICELESAAPLPMAQISSNNRIVTPSLLFHTHKCPSHPRSVHPDAEEINNSEMQWPGSARAQRDGLPPVRISVTFSALLPFLENFL